MTPPLFTVFTPTYNRAHTLDRVFNSLRAQTLRSFEWLVVDDGSTDNTHELIGQWSKTADFPIRYFRQENAGKHIAFNHALTRAEGEFFTVLDSDDACVPKALERFFHHWNTIPPGERPAFVGVDVLCSDQDGNVIGDPYPSSPFDMDHRTRHYVYKITGEKWGCGLTSILRRYPFPEVAVGQYVPEGLVWLAIGKSYKARAVNEALRIYWNEAKERRITVDRFTWLTRATLGRWHYYRWVLNNDLEFFWRAPLRFLHAAVILPVLGWNGGQDTKTTLSAIEPMPGKLLLVLGLPAALALQLFVQIKARSVEREERG
jgi:glycosyltransferase involved in cell wall biosynthesis